jgi:hypothetical protein
MARLGQVPIVPISEKNYWKNPSNYVALFTLAAVITYTGFQIWQTFLIRSNNVVSQRAFVFVDSPGGNVVIDAKDKMTKDFLISVPFINGGNTASKNLTTFIRCAPLTDSLPEPWVLLYRESPQRISAGAWSSPKRTSPLYFPS